MVFHSLGLAAANKITHILASLDLNVATSLFLIACFAAVSVAALMFALVLGSYVLVRTIIYVRNWRRSRQASWYWREPQHLPLSALISNTNTASRDTTTGLPFGAGMDLSSPCTIPPPESEKHDI